MAYPLGIPWFQVLIWIHHKIFLLDWYLFLNGCLQITLIQICFWITKLFEAISSMDASFFSKPLSQLECRDNKKSCHLLEKKGTHLQWECMITIPHATEAIRMHWFLDTTNTTCNRSNQNARLPDTHSFYSTNQHPVTPDTTKTWVLLKCGTMLKSIPCVEFDLINTFTKILAAAVISWC